MRRFFDRAVPLLLAAQLVFSATSVHADDSAPIGAAPAEVEKARLLYNEALDLRDAGDKKGALQFFLSAFSHVKSPVQAGFQLSLQFVRKLCPDILRCNLQKAKQERSRKQ